MRCRFELTESMSSIRKVSQVLRSRPTMEGAGVRLNRVFGNAHVPLFDPYLLLDDFSSDDPDDYIAGFPWHPHRGIETVTYLLKGLVRHEDSLGNNGVIGPGDVQWMSSGSGIVHQEMPEQDQGQLHGFQLWVNLPAAHKMDPPRYQEVRSADIPEVDLHEGGRVRVIAGDYDGRQGPIRDILSQPLYLDVSLPEDGQFQIPIERGHTAFAYLVEGTAAFAPDGEAGHPSGNVVMLEKEGDGLFIQAGSPARLLLIAGKPLGEPVAWWGPMVMNTQAQLEQAFDEYRNGTFIKS